MKISALMLTFVVAIASGCASTESVKQTQGQGVSRSYPYAYEAVYKATIAAAKTKELEVVEDDKSGGRLILAHGVTLWSWGERIAVFMKRSNPIKTEVEIVSKPVMSPLNFPPDWQNILLDQIDRELRTGK